MDCIYGLEKVQEYLVKQAAPLKAEVEEAEAKLAAAKEELQHVSQQLTASRTELRAVQGRVYTAEAALKQAT